MCELLGLSFDRSINARFSFQGLLEGVPGNRAGWGLGVYPEESGSALVLKEPIRGDKSFLAELPRSYQQIKSQIVIGHIRNASPGIGIRHDNTHPFNRFFCRREWLFAHNGTLRNYRDLPIQSSKSWPIGTTDSEWAFCKLLQEMSRLRVHPRRSNNEYQGFSENQFVLIKEILSEIHHISGGSFNCLFSEGMHLFCYRGDASGSNERSLHYLHRKPPYSRVRMRDEEIEIDLGDEKGGEEGYVIATTSLSDEEWQPFALGELRVFSNGRMTVVP